MRLGKCLQKFWHLQITWKDTQECCEIPITIMRQHKGITWKDIQECCEISIAIMPQHKGITWKDIQECCEITIAIMPQHKTVVPSHESDGLQNLNVLLCFILSL